MEKYNSTESIKLKQQVGFEAAKLIDNNMIVGLGTGTTAHYFITSLAQRCKEGLNIKAIATSNESANLAKSLGITLLQPQEILQIDITVDGADEIDSKLRLIKGGGGALLREKIIASSSKQMVVIADESKLKHNLGSFGLPVEIIPFCHNATIKKLNDKGFLGVIRKNTNGDIFVTDNHNFIFDVKFQGVCKDPEHTYELIRSTTGVVEVGFFFNIAKKAIISFSDGSIKTIYP
jgi:ribose 5-phosphate isomerase A